MLQQQKMTYSIQRVLIQIENPKRIHLVDIQESWQAFKSLLYHDGTFYIHNIFKDGYTENMR